MNWLSSPVFLTAPRGDVNRVFVVEQGGTIKVLDRASGTVLSTFLTVSGLTSGGERGVLGLAFDPNYTDNGRFYVQYTDVNGAITMRLRSVLGPIVIGLNKLSVPLFMFVSQKRKSGQCLTKEYK